MKSLPELDLQSYRHRVKEYLLNHILWAVGIFIFSAWMSMSWFVFMAEKDAPGANILSYGDGIWWGIVTLLTIGYGDKYPITTEGREFAGLLMISGVVSVGILTAKVSSVFLERALREGRGFVDTKNLKNHFVICGWNEDMFELIHHMLDFNPNMTSKEIVVLGNIPPTMIDSLKGDPKLKDVQIIVGDHFTAMNLKRAAPDRARKILILGDRTVGHNGQPPTATEVDARTIMTAMTLANIARGTLVTAEILDPKMDHYLKLAGVSEIIYSSEYSRLILGNASSGTGLANIVHDLLDPKTHSVMTTIPIPEKFIGTEYGRLKFTVEKADKHYLVIGLLENSGNSHQIKETALKRAQKTPNVTELVRNLHEVKELRCNHPIIHPRANFLIKEGTMAIVIENRAERSDDVTGFKKIAA